VHVTDQLAYRLLVLSGRVGRDASWYLSYDCSTRVWTIVPTPKQRTTFRCTHFSLT